MPSYKQLTLTDLEIKALWLIAEVGMSKIPAQIKNDPMLHDAADSAARKLWCAHTGHRMPTNTAPHHTTRGPELNVERKRPA